VHIFCDVCKGHDIVATVMLKQLIVTVDDTFFIVHFQTLICSSTISTRTISFSLFCKSQDSTAYFLLIRFLVI